MIKNDGLRYETAPGAENLNRSATVTFFRDPLILAIFFGSLSLYLICMPKTIALEDDSIFVLAGYFNGVSHPPGYPLYTLILNLLIKIPLGDIPARAHASSAFFGALACCSLFCIFRLTGLGRHISALGVTMFALSGTFWSQSIITEVYSLNLFLNLCLLFFALRIFFDFQAAAKPAIAAPRDFYLFSIALGLAVSNHWPLTVLIFPAYLLLIAKPFFALSNRIPVILPAVFIAAIFYGYLYFNNQSSPPINFSGKFGGPGEFIDYVLRSHYASVDTADSAGWLDKWHFMQDVLLQFGRELNLLLVLAGYGLYRLLKSTQSRTIGLALCWAVFSNSLLLVLLLNFDYGYFYSTAFKVYPIASIASMFVLAGFGMQIGSGASGPIKENSLVFALLIGLGFNLYFSLPQNYRHQYSWSEEFSERVFSELPANAVLFTDGDVDLGVLSYYHLIEQRRPDVTLYSSSGLLLDNRLFDYRLEDKKNFIENYVAENAQQQIYATQNHYGVSMVSGSVFTAKLGATEGKPKRAITNADIDLLLKWSADDYSHDPWTRIAVGLLRQKAISILAPVLKTGDDAALISFVSSSIDRLIQTDSDLLSFLGLALKDVTDINTDFYLDQLASIDRGELLSKQDDSNYVYIEARASQVRQTAEHIKNSRRQACLNWPSVKNTYCQAEADG